MIQSRQENLLREKSELMHGREIMGAMTREKHEQWFATLTPEQQQTNMERALDAFHKRSSARAGTGRRGRSSPGYPLAAAGME